ncbi:hypothetical protein JOD69_004072, partial [Methylocaldum sp. RMAD-M]|nr:hypothetical protein [Methylocaldum sp. RMAD-M]
MDGIGFVGKGLPTLYLDSGFHKRQNLRLIIGPRRWAR